MALRADRQGPHRVAFEKNKKILMKTQNTCGICGKPIDKSFKAPHPLSPVVDHMVPINKGGHPSSIENLQLAHWTCNRQKSDKLYTTKTHEQTIADLNKQIAEKETVNLRTRIALQNGLPIDLADRLVR